MGVSPNIESKETIVMEKIQSLRSKSVVIQEVVDVWKTKDGEEFINKKDAIAHEKSLDAKERYSKLIKAKVFDGDVELVYLRGQADIDTIADYHRLSKVDDTMETDIIVFPRLARLIVVEWENDRGYWVEISLTSCDADLGMINYLSGH